MYLNLSEREVLLSPNPKESREGGVDLVVAGGVSLT